MISLVRSIGLRSGGAVLRLGQAGVFAAKLVTCLMTPPIRVRRLLDEAFGVGVLSLLIVCLSGGVVGGVMALQGHVTLSRFGATGALGTLVSLTLIRELGPVLTALLVTGRAGSAIAAEIGAMVSTQQLDGLRMMSVDPVHFVAAPKALAMVLVMPLLNALFIVCGLAGGYLVGVQLLGVDGGAYISSIEQTVTFADDVLGSLLKSLVFGILVGLVATYRGYTSQPTAAGVSASTTGTVVVASVWTFVLDYFITALWEM